MALVRASGRTPCRKACGFCLHKQTSRRCYHAIRIVLKTSELCRFAARVRLR